MSKFQNIEKEIFELIRQKIRTILKKDNDVECGYEILRKLEIERFRNAIVRILEIDASILYPFFESIFFDMDQTIYESDKNFLKETGIPNGQFVLKMVKYNVRKGEYENPNLIMFNKLNDIFRRIPRKEDISVNKKELTIQSIIQQIRDKAGEYRKIFTLVHQVTIPYKLFYLYLEKYGLLSDTEFMKQWLEYNYYSFDDFFMIRLEDYVDDIMKNKLEADREKWRKQTVMKPQNGGGVNLNIMNIFKEKFDPTFHYYHFYPNSNSVNIFSRDKTKSGTYDYQDFIFSLSKHGRDILTSIRPLEFFDEAWSKDNLKYRSRNVREHITFQDSISLYFKFYLLLSQDKEQTTQFSKDEENRFIRRVKKIIRMINILVKKGDWYVSAALYLSLNDISIYRIIKKLIPGLIKNNNIIVENEAFMKYCNDFIIDEPYRNNLLNYVLAIHPLAEIVRTYSNENKGKFNIIFYQAIYKSLSPLIQVQENKSDIINYNNKLVTNYISSIYKISKIIEKNKTGNRKDRYDTKLYNRSQILLPRSQ